MMNAIFSCDLCCDEMWAGMRKFTKSWKDNTPKIDNQFRGHWTDTERKQQSRTSSMQDGQFGLTTTIQKSRFACSLFFPFCSLSCFSCPWTPYSLGSQCFLGHEHFKMASTVDFETVYWRQNLLMDCCKICSLPHECCHVQPPLGWTSNKTETNVLTQVWTNTNKAGSQPCLQQSWTHPSSLSNHIPSCSTRAGESEQPTNIGFSTTRPVR